jgi:capsid protein
MAGFRRKQARLALNIAGRAYDGAKTGRRTDGWMTASSSANSEIGAAGNRLRDRARDLARNNPYGKKSQARVQR